MRMEPKLCATEQCSGCTACMSICPVSAIAMRENDRGFLCPTIDTTKCIECGLCTAVSKAVSSSVQLRGTQPKSYKAIKHKDDAQRKKSQSGGLFYAIAKAVIDRNGVVYGCAYLNNFYVGHIRVDDLNALERLRGSKYVQSDMGNSFSQVAKDLHLGRTVLFSGTPCQSAGLQVFLDKKHVPVNNLYCCDLICHGVPSPVLYGKYLKYMEAKYNSKIHAVNLRDKSVTIWHDHMDTISFGNGKAYCGKIYTDLFYSELAMRQSCETCPYASAMRVSDITIGDCWGIEKKHPQLWNDELGISVALVITEKGQELLELAEIQLDIQELESYTQPTLRQPMPVPKQKENFWKDYQKLDFETLLKRYTNLGGYPLKIKRKLLRFLKKW